MSVMNPNRLILGTNEDEFLSAHISPRDNGNCFIRAQKPSSYEISIELKIDGHGCDFRGRYSYKSLKNGDVESGDITAIFEERALRLTAIDDSERRLCCAPEREIWRVTLDQKTYRKLSDYSLDVKACRDKEHEPHAIKAKKEHKSSN
jgi:hypothetical protein